MNLDNLYLTTLIPEFPRIYNNNNLAFKAYLDVIYDENSGVVIVPVTTSGRIKGATGEFVSLVVDNLTVKSQYTNLYDNITTVDYQYYTTYIGLSAVVRDACTTLWEDTRFHYVDVDAPYYKVYNDVSVSFKTDTLGQVVQILFDLSVNRPYTIQLSKTQTIGVTYANASTGTWLQLICVGVDASGLNTWAVKEYGGTFTKYAI